MAPRLRADCRGALSYAMSEPQAPEPIDLSAMLPEVYDTLRAMAARLWRERRPGVTLQPTVLVHEVYLRLTRDPSRVWESRAHVVAVAARAMRQVLADRARRRSSLKRGGDQVQVTLTGLGAGGDPADLIALDRALGELEALDPRRAQVFVLRSFGGLTADEVATVVGVSSRTVATDWRVGRAWLAARIDADHAA